MFTKEPSKKGALAPRGKSGGDRADSAAPVDNGGRVHDITLINNGSPADGDSSINKVNSTGDTFSTENETESLISGTRAGDAHAFGKLAEAYEPLINSLVGKYDEIIKNSGGISEPEDLRQEAALALYRAAMSYEKSAGPTFGIYAKICIRNSLVTEVRSAVIIRTTGEHRTAGEHRSNGTIRSAGIKYFSFDDDRLTREPGNGNNPESDMIAEENTRLLMAALGEILTGLEYNVMRLYLAGKSYKEIATETGRNTKAVDNALRRIKTKLKGRKLF